MQCTGVSRFFLHTFLFVTNSSLAPPPATYLPTMAANNSLSDWLSLANGTRPARVNEGLQGVLACLQMYILPVLIVAGVVGCVLGTTVLLGTFLRYKFLSHILACLDVSCAAFLLTVFLSWLQDNAVDVFSVPGLCQLHVFSSHFFTFLAVWHSVLATFLVLLEWLRPGTWPCLHSPTAAKTAVMSLAVLGFTVYSYKTWTHLALEHRGSRVCTVIPENEAAMEILNTLDVLLLLVLPSFLHLVFVVVMLVSRLLPVPVWCCSCRPACPTHSYSLPAGDDTAGVEGGMGAGVGVRRRWREVQSLVLMQSLCFLLLVAPRALSTLQVVVQRWVYLHHQTTDDIPLLHVFQLSFYAYFALLPYCPLLSSSKFRLHCRSLFARPGPRPHRHVNAVVTG